MPLAAPRALLARPRLLLAAAVVLCYASSLWYPLQFDDFGAIVGDPASESLSGWLAALGRTRRPLLKLSFVVSGWAPGTWGFHLLNVAVHVLNAWLVAALFSAAATRGPPAAGAPGSAGALVAGALFAVHPLHTEAVTYVSGRSASLVALLCLGALLLHARGLRAGRPLASLVLAPLLFLAAILTKESAVALPLGILLWDLTVERPPIRTLVLHHAVWWGLLAAVLLGAVLHDATFKLLYAAIDARPLSARVTSQLEGIGYLVSRLVAVGRLSIDPGLGARAPSAGLVALGLAATLSLGILGAAAAIRGRAPVVGFGALWFLLALLVPYALVPRADVLNERHAYLADVGLALLAGAALERGLRRAAWAWGPALALVLAALAAATIARSADYRTDVALWESTARTSPENARAHNNLGVAYARAGRLGEARTAFLRAVELEPAYPRARRNLERVEQELCAARP
jgi:tetratricopeptide (TPR) repeat protein